MEHIEEGSSVGSCFREEINVLVFVLLLQSRHNNNVAEIFSQTFAVMRSRDYFFVEIRCLVRACRRLKRRRRRRRRHSRTSSILRFLSQERFNFFSLKDIKIFKSLDLLVPPVTQKNFPISLFFREIDVLGCGGHGSFLDPKIIRLNPASMT